MISNYKLKKIQAQVTKLHKSGASKQKIGKFLNSEFKPFISVGSLNELEHDNSIETNLKVSSGLSVTKFKKLKTDIYKNLNSGKKIQLVKKFSPYVSDLNILDNVDKTPVDMLLNNKDFKARLIVFEWQNIKTKQIVYTSLKIIESAKTKEDIKEIIEYEIYKKNQSAKTLRLLNISFRFIDFKK